MTLLCSWRLFLRMTLGYCCSGSRGYQKIILWVREGSHFCLSRGAGVTQNHGGYTGRIIKRHISQGVQGVRGTHFSSGWHVYAASARRDYSGSVGLPLGFESQGFRQHPHHSWLIDVAVFCVIVCTRYVCMCVPVCMSVCYMCVCGHLCWVRACVGTCEWVHVCVCASGRICTCER